MTTIKKHSLFSRNLSLIYFAIVIRNSQEHLQEFDLKMLGEKKKNIHLSKIPMNSNVLGVT